MRRRSPRAIVAAAALVAAPVHRVDAAGCVAIADLTAPASFARYPAAARATRWHAPDVRSGEAHLFRTSLRAGSDGAPNFAGRYTVVEIGCGAGAVCPAFVDRTSGRVRFVPGLRVVAELGGGFASSAVDYERLTYRRDSRLLVVLGAPDEVQARSGAHLYDWHAGRPHLIRFVPQARLCRGHAPR